ncbi:MAG TPA: hypothetical protein VGM91_01040 [Conexibacter sp.]
MRTARDAARSKRAAVSVALIALAVAVCCLAGAVVPAGAWAQISITSFDGSVNNPDGSPATQAGAHPDATTSFTFATRQVDGSANVVEDPKDVTIDLPRGLVGNPQATSKCEPAQLAPNSWGCPDASQVGFVRLALTAQPAPDPFELYLPLYNMDPPPGMPGQFAFNFNGQIIRLNARVDPARGYAISLDVKNISSGIGVAATSATLWGVPGDPSHDGQRGVCLGVIDPTPVSPGCPSGGAPRTPFLTNPTDCSTGPVTTTMTATSWQDPSAVSTKSFVSHDNGMPTRQIGPDGCDRLQFAPTLKFTPTSSTAGQPSGATVDLQVPQNDNPDGVASATLRKAVVRLPQGVAVSPSAADGLDACGVDQIALGSAAAPTCPDASKIGTVSIDTPLLGSPLTGSVYLARQTPDRLLKIYLVASGDGVTIKLPGDIDADHDTGQVTATFDNNPQLPFSALHIAFNGGPRAPLSSPSTCGTYTTTSEMTAWSGQVVDSSSSFTIDHGAGGGPCQPLGFAPSFAAGTANPAGGQDSSFSLTFGRNDGDQALRDISVAMPKGLLGRIAQVPLCPSAAAANGTCDPGTQIGTVTTAAGPGSDPFYLPGKVFLTDSYNGQPYGLAIVVPAVAGPFDLGTVVVRASIAVDHADASLRIASGPLPSNLMGIPLQIRTVSVNIDRPGFIFNPTNCTPTQVGATIDSQQGATANVSSRFQAGNCATLPFVPRMTLRVGARGHTKAKTTTPVSVTLSMSNGQANNRVVDVDLPRTLNAELNVVNVRNSCSPAQYQADSCPLQVGTATAVTPLLRDPLVGKVFLVRNGRRLPDMMVRLRGQGDASLVDIDLTGKITIPKDLTVRTTFDTVPDVPITTFRLNLVSGRNAPVGTVRNLCMKSTRRASVAKLTFTAQSGKKIRRNQTLTVSGCARTVPEKRATRKHRRPSKQHRSHRRAHKTPTKGHHKTANR